MGSGDLIATISSALNLLGLRYLHHGSEHNHSRAILKNRIAGGTSMQGFHCTFFCTLRGAAYLALDGEAFSMMSGCLQAIAWSWVLQLRTPESRSCAGAPSRRQIPLGASTPRWSTVLMADSCASLCSWCMFFCLRNGKGVLDVSTNALSLGFHERLGLCGYRIAVQLAVIACPVLHSCCIADSPGG
jgi:hypothetical protein